MSHGRPGAPVVAPQLVALPTGPDDDLVAALEAMLFAVGEPVDVASLAAAAERSAPEVQGALRSLQGRLGRGIELVEVAGGWQLRTHPRHAEAVVRLLGGRPARLSAQALEVLAVVAYRQPVTRQEIDDVRGVDSSGVLKRLLERRLVRAAGRRDEPGRPLQYATTAAFLELFGLMDLSALPTLQERADLDGEG